MIVDIPFKDVAELTRAKFSLDELVKVLDMFGTPVEEFDDRTLRLEVFPNRLDMLSAEGVARAVDGIFGSQIGYPIWQIRPSKIEMNVEGSNIRPFVSFSEVRGIKFTESSLKGLMQMQEKLHLTAGRDRRKYSIGVYDADKIKSPITYTERPLEDIVFTPLEEKTDLTGKEILESTEKGRRYAHLIPEDRAPVLLDSADRILSMPPIINADFCRVNEDTENAFIDSTGTSEGTEDIVALVATSLVERGKSLNVIVPGPSYLQRRMAVDLKYINKITGLSLKEKSLHRLFNKMRLGYDGEAIIPPYRMDIMGHIDLAEDIAIAHGYPEFTGTLSPSSESGEPLPVKVLEDELRRIMIGFGFIELKTFILTSPGLLALAGGHELSVSNPKNTEYSALRQSLLPGLLDTMERNKGAEYPQRLFEIGKVFTPERGLRLSALITHPEAGFSEIKGIVDQLTRIMGASFEWSAGDHPFFMEGRTATSSSGVYGEVSPTISERLGLPVIGFELDLETIL